MKIATVILTLVLTASCSKRMHKSEEIKGPCNREKAVKIAIDNLERHKLLSYEPDVEIQEELQNFTIIVLPMSKERLGSGAKFLISKETCEILEGELFQ